MATDPTNPGIIDETPTGMTAASVQPDAATPEQLETIRRAQIALDDSDFALVLGENGGLTSYVLKRDLDFDVNQLAAMFAFIIPSRWEAKLERELAHRDVLLEEACMLLSRALGTCVGLKAHVEPGHSAREATDELTDAIGKFLGRRAS